MRHLEVVLPEVARMVLDAAPTGMIMVDDRGLIVLVNRHVELLFGYAREELIGQPIEALIPARFRGGHPGYRAAFAGDPRTRPMGAGRDLYGLRKDGREVPIEIGLNPLVIGEDTFILSSIVDISARKEAERRIRASLREKEVLLKEIHHRIKNNLQIVSSMLNLQAGQSDDERVRAMFEASQNRVRSIALMHEILYQVKDLAHVDFTGYIRALMDGLFHSLARSGITWRLDAGPTRLSLDQAIPCGLLVNELVTNALKHAFPDGRPGEIAIHLARLDGDTVELDVSDDGVGLPAHLDPHRCATLGLDLVFTIAEQLAAEVDVRRDGGVGYRFRFHAPCQADEVQA
ncbi:MAG TPA: histidine kinase dimerization/phosphoacceptor domain -containing protein [Kofleriaceae bacterium]|nr:histidine kinase dimerization/phosphoacceptor domain -containing protein [Kofleriaceae bacterium]